MTGMLKLKAAFTYVAAFGRRAGWEVRDATSGLTR